MSVAEVDGLEAGDYGSVELELAALDNLLPPPHLALPCVRCERIKPSGERCRRQALRGATVCLKHGGQLPAVKKAAEERVWSARILLMRNAPKVSQKLIDIALGKIDGLPHQVTAARAVLDRAGLTPVQRVESNVTVHLAADPVDEEIDSLIERRADAIEVSASVVESGTTDETEDER